MHTFSHTILISTQNKPWKNVPLSSWKSGGSRPMDFRCSGVAAESDIISPIASWNPSLAPSLSRNGWMAYAISYWMCPISWWAVKKWSIVTFVHILILHKNEQDENESHWISFNHDNTVVWSFGSVNSLSKTYSPLNLEYLHLLSLSTIAQYKVMGKAESYSLAHTNRKRSKNSML